MKISGKIPPDNQGIVLPAQRGGTSDLREAGQPVSRPRTGDRVQISDHARKVAELVSVMKQMPDIRNEKVQEMKELVDSGKYTPNPVVIAEKLISEL